MENHKMNTLIKGTLHEIILKKSMDRNTSISNYCFCPDCRCQQVRLNVVTSKELKLTM